MLKIGDRVRYGPTVPGGLYAYPYEIADVSVFDDDSVPGVTIYKLRSNRSGTVFARWYPEDKLTVAPKDVTVHVIGVAADDVTTAIRNRFPNATVEVVADARR